MPIRSLRKRQQGKPVIYCFSFSGASHCQTPEQRDKSHKPRGVSRFFRALKAKTRRLKLRIPSGTTSWAELITPALHPGPRTATNPKSDPASHSQTQLQSPPGNISHFLFTKVPSDQGHFTFLKPPGKFWLLLVDLGER